MIKIVIVAIFIMLTAFFILDLFYLYTRFKKFYCIRTISNNKKWLLRLLSAIPILFIIICGVFDVINTLIIIIHLIVFWLLIDFVWRFVKKDTKFYWQGIFAILLTTVYLSFGWFNAHQVSETHYSLNTDKNIGAKSLRIVQISDSHMGATFDGDGFAEHMQTIQKTNPDLLVITGDYVDDATTREDMLKSCTALGKFKTTYGIFFVYGNHDKGYFKYRDFSKDELAAELKKNNVRVLEDESVLINDKFYVIGRQDRSEKSRKSINDLTKKLDQSKYMIVLDHQPNDFDAEAKAGVDLVLCGHTHGGQIIPIGITGELSGVNDKTYGLEMRYKTAFIVNSGISDWAIKFKTGTFSEYGVIDVKGR